jgi:hypothetical protein
MYPHVRRAAAVPVVARALTLAVVLAASTALGQEPGYEPQIGQPGKDVVWVPTPEPLVERMLAMAQVGPTFSIDLEQTFQKIGGTVDLGRVRGGLRDARLHGDVLRFAFVDGKGVLHELDGRATGDRLEGTFRAGTRKGRFSATRRTEPKALSGLQVSSVRIM